MPHLPAKNRCVNPCLAHGAGQEAYSKFTNFEKQFWDIKKSRFDVVLFFKKGKVGGASRCCGARSRLRFRAAIRRIGRLLS